LQEISWPNCLLPAQFIHRQTDRSANRFEFSRHEKPHAHRRRVPATRGEPFENALFRHVDIEMKRLRIELPRKLEDTLFCNLDGVGTKPVADAKVLQI